MLIYLKQKHGIYGFILFQTSDIKTLNTMGEKLRSYLAASFILIIG